MPTFESNKKRFLFLLRPKSDQEEEESNTAEYISELRKSLEEKNAKARTEITESIQIL